MKVLIYARVSLDPRGQGRSVAEQEAEARAWAAREGWTVERVIHETGSASRYASHQRDGWAEVMDAIQRRETEAVITWEASRATRDLTAYAALRDACAEADVLWGYSGALYDLSKRDARFRTGLDALLAEDEAARTSERVKRAVRATAQAGRPHGKNVWGYRRVYDAESRQLLRVEPDPITGPLVQEAARRVLAGESCYSVAKDFNARGIPPRRPAYKAHRRGLGWTMAGVRQMLGMPVYAGRRSHNGEMIERAVWPALIPPDDFDRLQAIFSARHRTNDWIAAHLLSGIAVCGICGTACRVGKQNAGSRRTKADGTPIPRAFYRTYLCSGTPGKTGFHVAMKEAHLDLIVTEAVIARLERPDFLAILGEADSGVDAERAALLSAIEEHRAYLDVVRERAAKERRPDLLFDQEARVQPLIRDAENRLRRLAGADPVVLDLAQSGHVRETFTAMPITEKREVIRALVVPRLNRSARGRGAKGLEPERVELVWH